MIRFRRRLRFILQRCAVWAGVFLLSLVLTPVSESSAQPVDEDSLQQAAREDYHGIDLRGKDGPLSKAGMDLLLLYHRWTSGAAGRQGVSGSLQIQNGRVTVDAIAAGTTANLASDLKRLGATNVATAGALVSGQIPISSIPDAARLPTLRSMRPSRPRTQQSGPGSGAVPEAVRVSPSDSAEAPAPTPARTDAAAPAPRDADPNARPATNAAPDSTKKGSDDAASDRAPDPTAAATPDSSREGERPAQTGIQPAPEEAASSTTRPPSGDDEAKDGAFLFLALLLVITVVVSDEM